MNFNFTPENEFKEKVRRIKINSIIFERKCDLLNVDLNSMRTNLYRGKELLIEMVASIMAIINTREIIEKIKYSDLYKLKFEDDLGLILGSLNSKGNIHPKEDDYFIYGLHEAQRIKSIHNFLVYQPLVISIGLEGFEYRTEMFKLFVSNCAVLASSIRSDSTTGSSKKTSSPYATEIVKGLAKPPLVPKSGDKAIRKTEDISEEEAEEIIEGVDELEEFEEDEDVPEFN